MSIELFKTSQLYTRKSTNLTRLGFDFDAPIEAEYLKIQSMLYSEYHIKCESMLTIMKTFAIPSSRTMDILFRLFDIEARSWSESQSNAIYTGRFTIPCHTKFVHIYHKTWYGDTVLLRSSYEEEYANILDESRIMYFVEHIRIKYLDISEQKYKIAIPDFILPESNTITEVKATYWLNEEQMESKRLAYIKLGYKFNLYLDHILIENWYSRRDLNSQHPD